MKYLIKEFIDEAQKIYEEMAPTPGSFKLYHYTTYEGLKGILESKKLWLTDYRYLNDPTEILYGRDIIIKAIKSYNSTIPLSSSHQFYEKIIEFYPDFVKKNEIYIFSFCEEKDYYPAWRFYGEEGNGFSIKFNSNLVKEIETVGRHMFQVDYGHAKCYEIVQKLCSLAEECKENYDKNNPDKDINSRNEFHKQLKASLFSSIHISLPGFKNENFNREKEIRIIEEENKANDGIKYPAPINLSRKFTISNKRKKGIYPMKLINDKINSTVIPKIKWGFNPDDIIEIWTGPNLDPEDAKEKVNYLLQKYKYDLTKIQIFSSKALKLS